MQYQGTVEVFNNRKFINRLQYKEMFEAKFFQMYFFIEYCYFPSNIVVSLFVLLDDLIYLKTKVQNFATTSAFALFFVICIHSWTVNGCMVLFWYCLMVMWKLFHDPGKILVSPFSLPLEPESLSTNNYTKFFSLKAYIAVHKFYTICLSETETHIDSSIALDDDN